MYKHIFNIYIHTINSKAICISFPTKCSEFYRVNIRDEEKFLSNYLRWYLLAFVNSLFLFNKRMPLKCSVMWYFSMRYSGQQLIFVLLFTFSIIDQFILYGVPFLYLLTYLDSSVLLMCSYGRNPYCDSGIFICSWNPY